MAHPYLRKLPAAATGIALIGVLAWMLWPQPQPVDLAKVSAGPMIVTIDEEGKNVVKTVFTISAPVAGKMERQGLKVGDRVEAGKTTLAVIHPADPAIIDARTREILLAQLEAAKAARDLAAEQLGQQNATLRYAEDQLKRQSELNDRGLISLSAFERQQLETVSAHKAVQIATAELDLRSHNLDLALAQLASPAADGADAAVSLVAPAAGTVLSLAVESEKVVAPGTELLRFGDPASPEVVVDLLSRDAAAIRPGARATISGWSSANGADASAHVTRIDPTAYTRVSALGVEEQRVKLVLDYDVPPGVPSGLGDGFRVDVHINTWSSEGVLQAPLGALFRDGNVWAAFKADGGHAVLVHVDVGHIGKDTAEITSGLIAGDQVVLYPGDTIADGVNIKAR